MQEIKRGSVGSHSVENLLWKRLWTCRKTDYRITTTTMMMVMMMMMMMIMLLRYVSENCVVLVT